MSAIAAIWTQRPGGQVPALLASMLQALALHGPDGIGTWSGDQVGLGRDLMKLVPEDSFDEQPVWSPDRTCCIVADVRLDNRGELSAELDLTATAEMPDVRILLAAWQRWGPDCVHHVIGAFAFVVWTPARKELFAARDHGGDCPLVFHHSSSLFAIASMPKGLRALPGVGAAFNEVWIADWFFSSGHVGQATIFAGIERLRPGHRLIYSEAGLKIESYWNPFSARPIRFKRDAEYAEGLVEVLDRATAARLRRIGGVAAHLSSGLDSSSVMASAAILLARTGDTLRAYTSVPQPGFSSDSYSKRPVIDEGPFAAEAAALYPNVEHVPFTTAGMQLLPSLQRYSALLDEPFLNGVNAMWLSGILADCRQRGIGVVLQGAAGNGTISFQSLSIASRWLRTGQWVKLLRHLRTLRATNEMSYRNAVKEIFEDALPLAWIHRSWQKGVAFDHMGSLLREDFVLEQRVAERAIEQQFSAGVGYEAARLQLFSLVDAGRLNAAARAIGHIDLRDPTSDKRVWEYTHAIPYSQYAIDGHTRSLVRRAMRGRLPDATLDRYRQGRQGADWYITMKEQLPQLQQEVEEIAQSPAACRILDIPRIRELLDTFPSSGYGTIYVMNTWKYTLMRALSLGNFLRRNEASA